MSNRPAFHCGALECCEGAQYPECQKPTEADLALTFHHYDDDATGADQCPCSD